MNMKKFLLRWTGANLGGSKHKNIVRLMSNGERDRMLLAGFESHPFTII